MTSHPRSCDQRRLDLLLRDRLPDHSRQDVEAHLLICPACRDRLDELAGGARWWSHVRQYLGSDGAAEYDCTPGPSDMHDSASLGLDFLSPSEHATSLGRLGTYEVLEVIGRGGWGVVLKAFDPALHRPVAIKVLAAEYAASAAARKRFAREAQAAAAVVHDHVVPVHAVDAEATPPYLVMTFIPGRSLQQRIDQTGPLALKEILRIGMQTASGLAAAHAQGLVHRDIKPANIMLENGIERVRITDFGLARAVDDASMTLNGAVAGTPQYMAPEQARAEAVDQRADLFALGSTLYAMCTGEAPFRADSALGVLKQVCETEPASIRSLNPDVPIWLEGICRRLHAKEPPHRFQSAAEVADLLGRCLAHVQQPDHQPLPRLARELGRLVPDSQQSRRSRTSWLVATGLLAFVFVTAAVFGPGLGAKHNIGFPDPAPLPSAPPAEQIGTNLDTGFRDKANEVQEGLHNLRDWLTPAPPAAGMGVDNALDSLRLRASLLGQELGLAGETGPDPVKRELDEMRHRVKLLEQQVGGGPQ